MIPRTIKTEIEYCIKNRPVTLITGARQVGKTFICRELSKEHGFGYVSLADRMERELASKDPEAFLKLHEVPLIIDEVQYAPNLFDSIESAVDKELFDHGIANGMYILTGSQAYNLMQGVTQSMAGRVGIVRMSTLSISEINGRGSIPFTPDIERCYIRAKEVNRDISGIYSDILRGGYPELYNNPELRTYQFYSDYVDSYISKDVTQMINIKDQHKFMNFMQILASLTGQELVYDTISNAVGINIRTVKEWMSVLIAGDIIFLQQPYFKTSSVKRITKKPKLYFKDTGLACYLAKIPDSKTLEASYLKGPMAETYIVNEIMKSYQNNGENASFYHYRDSNDNEIDLIINKDGRLMLIECKGGIECGPDDAKAFDRMVDTDGCAKIQCIVCMSETPYPIVKEVYAVPVTSI